MELPDVITTQYAFPGLIVGTVLLFAFLVFVFGFKSPEEPAFDKLSDDKRGPNKKKKKPQSNGHAASVADVRRSDKSSKKEGDKSPLKTTAKKAVPVVKENKPKENQRARGKENIEVKTKNRKNKVIDEKPDDYDEGEWEPALSRKDKKNRKTTLEEILPQKNGIAVEKKKNKKKEEEPRAQATPEPVVPASVKTVVETEEKRKEKKPKKPVEKASPSPSPKPVAAKKKAEAKSAPTEPPVQTIPEEKQPKPVAAETPVAFDELGDTWTEAKLPKKSGKKKSRKD